MPVEQSAAVIGSKARILMKFCLEIPLKFALTRKLVQTGSWPAFVGRTRFGIPFFARAL